MKNYIKPEVEYVEFVTEVITDTGITGSVEQTPGVEE